MWTVPGIEPTTLRIVARCSTDCSTVAVEVDRSKSFISNTRSLKYVINGLFLLV